jgi:hypothetical protein
MARVRFSQREIFPWSSDAGGVTFRLEEELARPVTDWLEDDGFEVRREIPILGRRADLVGSRDDAVAAVEMKMTNWREALCQAIAYQLAADRAWVAMPLTAACRAYCHRWQFEAQRVGLLAIDDGGRIRTPIPAGASPRLLPFLQRRIIESWPP